MVHWLCGFAFLVATFKKCRNTWLVNLVLFKHKLNVCCKNTFQNFINIVTKSHLFHHLVTDLSFYRMSESVLRTFFYEIYYEYI